MGIIRAIIKLIIFLPLTLFLYLLNMVLTPLQIIGISHIRIRTFLLKIWGKCTCYIIGMKLKVEGEAPKAPFFLVSNHLSYLDVFLLFSQLRGVFVAKSDVKQWPVIGFMVRTCGILFIDRDRKRDITRVNKKISNNLNKHQGMIVFPESTTSPGFEVLPFRASLLQVPAETEFPVHYAIISYSTSSGEVDACRKICWWDDVPFLVHFFNVLKLKSFEAHLKFGRETVTSSNRKELAMKLERLVKSDFKPVIKEPDFKQLSTLNEKKKTA